MKGRIGNATILDERVIYVPRGCVPVALYRQERFVK